VAFETAFTSLLRAAKPALTPELRGKLQALGVEPERLQPAYPLATWLASIQLVGEACFPGVPPEEACFRTGQRFLESLESTPLGAAVFAVSRLVGTRRALARYARSARSSNNYTEASWCELGEREAELTSSIGAEFLPQVQLLPANVLPAFTRGILTGLGAATGAANIAVEVVASDPARRSTTYRLRW
jgi:uncharacterized protein (TIGR02265 family)